MNIGPSSPVRTVKRAATVAAAVFSLISALYGYGAISAEITGNAIYRNGGLHSAEKITRDDSPAKFRSATDQNWAASGVAAILAIVFVVLWRKIDDHA